MSQARLSYKVKRGPSTRSKAKGSKSVEDDASVIASPRTPSRRSTRNQSLLSSPSPRKRGGGEKPDPTIETSPSKRQRNTPTKETARAPLSPVKHIPNFKVCTNPSPTKNVSKENVGNAAKIRSAMGSPVRNVPRIRSSLLDMPIMPSPVKENQSICPSPVRNVPRIRRNILDAPMLPSPIKSPLKTTTPSKPASARKLILSPVRTNKSVENKSPSKLASRQLNFSESSKQDPSIGRLANETPSKSGKSPLRLAKQKGICYQRAKQALHAALPDQLVGREKEETVVRNFLEEHLEKKKAGSLYISGAPGTGKTAMVSHVIQGVKETKVPSIYVNCMSVKNSQAIYNKVCGELKKTKTSCSIKEASAECERLLSSKGPMVLLVLDEVDQLDSKNQEILYTMFEWPFMSKSRLVLIGIANALDLTERVLPRLKGKKCKPELLNFAPYTKDQIAAIVKERLEKVEVDGQMVLEPTAVEFCARKVAAVAGDMRKALDICRRAVEVVEADVTSQQVLHLESKSPKKLVPKKITVATINKVVNEVYGSRVVAQSRDAAMPLQHKLAICSLLLLSKQPKAKKEVTLGKLHDVYKKICKKQEVQPVDQAEFLNLCNLVEARGLISLKRGKDVRSFKVYLKLDEKELETAMQDKTLVAIILANGLPQ